MEKFIYEIRPYAFSIIGALSMSMAKGSNLRLMCGALLFSVAAYVIRQRYLNRVQIRYL